MVLRDTHESTTDADAETRVLYVPLAVQVVTICVEANAAGRLTNDLFAEIGTAADIGSQPVELLRVVGRHVSNPESGLCGRDPESQFAPGRVVAECFDLLPGVAIVADDRRRVFGN